MNESIAFSWTLMEREKQIVLRATRLMRVWGVKWLLDYTILDRSLAYHFRVYVNDTGSFLRLRTDVTRYVRP